jgi:hypothetical protein
MHYHVNIFPIPHHIHILLAMGFEFLMICIDISSILFGNSDGFSNYSRFSFKLILFEIFVIHLHVLLIIFTHHTNILFGG